MVLPDDKRYSEARMKAALSMARDFSDPDITPEVVLAAHDYKIHPRDLADAIRAIEPAREAVKSYRKTLLAELTRLTEELAPYE